MNTITKLTNILKNSQTVKKFNEISEKTIHGREHFIFTNHDKVIFGTSVIGIGSFCSYSWAKTASKKNDYELRNNSFIKRFLND